MLNDYNKKYSQKNLHEAHCIDKIISWQKGDPSKQDLLHQNCFDLVTSHTYLFYLL